MTTDLTTQTYTIPESRFAELEKRVNAYATRAAKLGQPPIEIQVLTEHPVEAKYEDPHGLLLSYDPPRYYTVFEVAVQGKAPRVNGYTLRARIEHTEAGNLLFQAPDAEGPLPERWRTAPPDCEHCGYTRKRLDTFLVESEDGTLRQIGRNCLADYVRSEDAAAALSLYNLLSQFRTLQAHEGDGELYGGYYYLTTERYLAYVVRAISERGWVSRSKARDDWSGQLQATADLAAWASGIQPVGQSAQEWKDLQPTAEDIQVARDALHYLYTLEPGNAYLYNLTIACDLMVAKPKHQGLIASLIAVYQRHLDQLAEQARREALNAERLSEHFGEEGARYVRPLTVVAERTIESDYGTSYLVTLEDAERRVYKWFSSNGAQVDGEDVEMGTTLHALFHVKRHTEYQGLRETHITRCTLQTTPPEKKWVDPDGRVYTRKKDLVAATTA